MRKNFSDVGKIMLWLYVVITSCTILLKTVVVMPVFGLPYLERVTATLSTAKPFFLLIVLPLVILTLWEIWDWDKLLSIGKHV